VADANESCDWRIYAELAHALIHIALPLDVHEPLAVDRSETVDALDATTVDLCLAWFPCAPFRSTNATIKLHMLLNLRGAMPIFLPIADGAVHKVNVLDILLPESVAVHVMDRGYLDVEHLYALQQAGSFFVIRARSNFQVPAGVFPSRQSAHWPHLRATRRTRGLLLPARVSRAAAPDSLSGRRRPYVRLSDQPSFAASPHTVCELYHQRWQIELLFKWVKQHRHIKRFFGPSENAVKSQIWIAVAVDVLVAIVRKRLNLCLSLHAMVQILNVTPFETVPLTQVRADIVENEMSPCDPNQMN
jgi:hypothetical protein